MSSTIEALLFAVGSEGLSLEELTKIEVEANFITNLVGNENEIMAKAMKKLDFESSDLITYYKMR